MAKSKYKIEIESWVALVIADLIFAALFLNEFLPSANIMRFFTTPTSAGGEYPFSFSDSLSYARIFLHVFGCFSHLSISLSLCLFVLIPNAEREFGTLPLIAMILISAGFSGVLCACFCGNTISGTEPILYLLILLNIFSGLKKKTIPILQLIFLAVLAITSLAFSDGRNAISVLSEIAGGLCGSLISFLTMPKTRKKDVPQKQKSKGKKAAPKSRNTEEDEITVIEPLDIE